MSLKKSFSIFVLLFAAVVAAAQNFPVKAQLQDADSGEPVGFATVSLTPEGASKASKYTLSDGEGHVTIEKVHPGKYTVKAELLGYKTWSVDMDLHKDNADLGVIKLALDSQVLDAAGVTAVGNPIEIKKDTIVYNASSFKTTENDMLVDLLKKLPGIEVSEDGSITSNGETINKITIDGKTFFLDDPQLASNNLPAKIIEKVKVVKKKSEQAEFTGIDDGEEETVIDLNVKKGMMKGLFGNVMAGGGHDIPSDAAAMNDWRYQGAFMGGRFTESSQISILANGNNTNNRGFNDMAGSMMNSMMGSSGGMGRGNGLPSRREAACHAEVGEGVKHRLVPDHAAADGLRPALADQIAVIFHVVHIRKRMPVHAEQLTVLFERQHVGIRIDARFVELIQTHQFVADLVRRIAEHQNDLLRALGDASQTNRKPVAGKNRENHADRSAAELLFHVRRNVVHRGVIALRARHNRFGHGDHVPVAQRKSVAAGRLEHAVRDDGRKVVPLPDDRAADAAGNCSDPSCCFHILNLLSMIKAPGDAAPRKKQISVSYLLY